MKQVIRCDWAGTDPLYQAYHDHEWGIAVHDERLLFEFICLEGQQAGLSWITVLKKRERYRQCFHNFEVEKVANMSDEYIEQQLSDPGLIRNRLKLFSIRKNALAFITVQQEFGSFDRYIWQFVGGQTQVNQYETMADVPANTAASDAMAKDLKKRGFSFIGTTICYAFMQAAGLVDDHLTTCYKRC
ncbi:DNA-3-methyladenine glycosylase 1 [Sinobacterium norvegicum]|uniref:DNA-3-methyladenine glycosylase 1 n=1 Tax=Sinobacterium norvegicum TaxID=1641715 RepID=A0ABM9AAT9_9GAMM|nr:DNA-3-methyladenine glycosylase I [Sinobacterium norvegicum]CAH0990351.1 DNA-3-methyladenine glycosylase 1 [Sinobacterium norvegicum]